ncbi:MAG: hypothetical protein AMJ72_05340 [Acidithiobacillales bacterium SM1_46]|nr:MAG: hypothetical protein AMJ72_05340 [Acidithiobacillales bacterium SM1_46]
MVDKSVILDVPTDIEVPEAATLKRIHWCDGHWAELLKALRERGLEDQISGSAEELNAKFIAGDLDPCWEACNMLNMGALEIFGPERVIDENAGCPVCAFANIIQHAADIMHGKYGSLN